MTWGDVVFAVTVVAIPLVAIEVYGWWALRRRRPSRDAHRRLMRELERQP